MGEVKEKIKKERRSRKLDCGSKFDCRVSLFSPFHVTSSSSSSLNMGKGIQWKSASDSDEASSFSPPPLLPWWSFSSSLSLPWGKTISLSLPHPREGRWYVLDSSQQPQFSSLPLPPSAGGFTQWMWRKEEERERESSFHGDTFDHNIWWLWFNRIEGSSRNSITAILEILFLITGWTKSKTTKCILNCSQRVLAERVFFPGIQQDHLQQQANSWTAMLTEII